MYEFSSVCTHFCTCICSRDVFQICMHVYMCVCMKRWHESDETISLIHHCCSVLQCFALCCSSLQCVAVRYSALQRVAVRCSALQCVAVRCSATHCRLIKAYKKNQSASQLIYMFFCRDIVKIGLYSDSRHASVHELVSLIHT